MQPLCFLGFQRFPWDHLKSHLLLYHLITHKLLPAPPSPTPALLPSKECTFWSTSSQGGTRDGKWEWHPGKPESLQFPEHQGGSYQKGRSTFTEGTNKCKSLQSWGSLTHFPYQSCSLASPAEEASDGRSFFLLCLNIKLNVCSRSSWIPVEASWDRTEDLLPRRQARLSQQRFGCGTRGPIYG